MCSKPEKNSSNAGGPETRTVKVSGRAGTFNVRYTQWKGPEDSGSVPIVCVHGLTRNGRDFDYLARALSSYATVICIDMPGRGNSDWLKASSDYNLDVYLDVVKAVVAHLNVPAIDYVGTSMGGIIGMMYASEADCPIRRLVLNDVGPFVPKAALKVIATYVGDDPTFASLTELEIYLRRRYVGFGRLTDEQWRHLASYSFRKRGEQYALAYDPKIGDAYKWVRYLPLFLLRDVRMWNQYDAITCPTLLLRGSNSALLLSETAEEMKRRGPKATVVEFPGVGHAPALMNDDQIESIRRFLVTVCE